VIKMPKELEDCVKKVMAQGKSRDSAFAICTAQLKKSKERNDFRFVTTITEIAQSQGGNFLNISGVAVDETVSYNGVKYIAEELRNACQTLSNKPILKDHKNEVDSIVGRITEAYFDESSKSVKYRGQIMDEKMKEMINDGRIKQVSIGAKVKELAKETKENVNYVIAKGIEFVELSLVAIHGVPNATVTNNSYVATLQEMIKTRGEAFMVQEPEAEVPKLEPEPEKPEEQLGEMEVLKAEIEKLKAEVEKLKAKLGAEEQEEEPKPEEVKPPEEEKKVETEALKKQLRVLESRINSITPKLKGRIASEKAKNISETFRIQKGREGTSFYDERLGTAKNLGEYLRMKGE